MTLLRESVRVAALSRDERLALALDRDWAPDDEPAPRRAERSG
jgi:hypothetical protein